MSCPENDFDELEAHDLELLQSFTDSPLKSPDKDNVKETILVEDEDMIVGHITSSEGEFDAEQDKNVASNVHMKSEVSSSRIVQNPLSKPVNGSSVSTDHQAQTKVLNQFSATEDLIIHALDTLSPFDAKFISDHLSEKDEAAVEKRLNDNQFRKLSFSFQKLPILMFEVVILNGHDVACKSLMLLTQKQLLELKCKQEQSYHGTGIETVKLPYIQRERFGIDTGQLCEFIITNIPSKHMPYLRRNVKQLEAFMETSKINFHKKCFTKSVITSIKSNNKKNAVTLESLRKSGEVPIKFDEKSGQLILNKDHEDTLKKIVKSVGTSKWEIVTKLLFAVYDNEIEDFEEEEICDKVADYYQSSLDPDLAIGFFTEDEEKCVIYMHKYWSQVMEDEALWQHIARHLRGRTAHQVKNRFLRTSHNPNDLTLENIERFASDASNPATFNNDLAHIFALTVISKHVAAGMEITAKLQHEVRFLVMGTMKEIFLLPCKDTAIRCSYNGVIHHNFTYDPTRPPQQFVTFIKLTFSNGMKKAGLIEDLDSFHFSDIVYKGESIHSIMTKAENERFIVPKEEFMYLNRKQENGITTEMVLPLKRKYTKKSDMIDLGSQKMKDKLLPPSVKRRVQ